MPSLAQLITEAQPDRSLLMSYGFSASTFETMLLRSMQRRGVGEVTILLDPRGVASTFAESSLARGPGVYYRLQPVPLARASFHCKLYLALTNREAILWVSSANLTPSGLYENAEVIDELRLRADGSGDVEAFYDYLDLLYTLSGAPDRLTAEVLAALRRIEHWIEGGLGSAGPQGPGGARLLHSGSEALLPQLLRLVPAAEVREVVAASPFYDARCAAVRSLAQAFPNAAITLLCRGDERDQIDGAALRPLSARLSVRAFQETQGHRRLHGKVVELRTGDASWVLIGSANLSRRAWLLAVPDGGNLEAMALRRFPLHPGTHPLFRDTLGEEIPLASLQRSAGEDDAEADTLPSLQVVSAEYGADTVAVRTSTPVLRLERVWVETQGQYHALPPEVTGLAPLVFRARWEEGRSYLDSTVVVHVEAISPEGSPLYGRGWLHRPEMIGLSSRTRSWRHTLLLVERDGWGYGEDDYGALSELWCHVAQRIAHRQSVLRPAPPTSGGGSGAGRPHQPPEERETGLPLLVSIAEMGGDPGLHAAHSPLALIRRAGETFRRLLTSQPDDALRREEGLDGEDEDDPDGSETARPRGRGPRPLSGAERRQAESADQQMFATIPVFFSTPPSPEAVAEMADALDVLLLALVQRYLRFREGHPFHARTVLQQLREVLGRAFGTDGAAYGEPRGWFVRAWLEPGTWDAVREAFADRDRVASAIFGLGILGIPTDPAQAASPAAIRALLGGVEVVSGLLHPLARAEYADTLATYAEALEPDSRGRGSGVDVLRVLEEASRRDLPLMAAARRYEAILRAEAGGPLPEGTDPLHRIYLRLRKPGRGAIVPVRASQGTVFCAECGSLVPLATAAKLEVSPEGAVCSGCRRLLVPFDPGHPRVRAIHAFFTGAET